MSEPSSTPPFPPRYPAFSAAQVVRPPLQLVRLPVDKSQPAVAFLQARSRGVMDLIAHFWERLAHTPPLQRGDLHLVVATPIDESTNININIPQLDSDSFSGAMLYVPKAHRAPTYWRWTLPTAAAFASYISHQGPKFIRNEGAVAAGGRELRPGRHRDLRIRDPFTTPMLPLTDLSAVTRSAANSEFPVEPFAPAKSDLNGRVPIDFLTGEAQAIGWMLPLLLPLVHRKAAARQLVNVVMQLPAEVGCEPDGHVRLAREADIPTLNRWRRNYKEERGIHFDADMDAWIERQRVFVYELEGQVVAVAKVDLELQNLVEIGGVYTFPEFRNKGYGAGIVCDIACRIRQMNKQPTLQVDEQNPALRLYESMGWQTLGKLARIWLTR